MSHSEIGSLLVTDRSYCENRGYIGISAAPQGAISVREDVDGGILLTCIRGSLLLSGQLVWGGHLGRDSSRRGGETITTSPASDLKVSLLSFSQDSYQTVHCPLCVGVHSGQCLVKFFERVAVDSLMLGQRLLYMGIQLSHHLAEAHHMSDRIAILEFVNRQLRRNLRDRGHSTNIEILLSFGDKAKVVPGRKRLLGLFHSQTGVTRHFYRHLYSAPKLVSVIAPLNARRNPNARADSQSANQRLRPAGHRGLVICQECPYRCPTEYQKGKNRHYPKERNCCDGVLEPREWGRLAQAGSTTGLHRNSLKHGGA